MKGRIALEYLLAHKVSYDHLSGKIENSQEMIHGAISNACIYTNFIREGTTIYFERSAAIVRHALNATSTDKEGKQSPLHIGILQVWVKQKKWKLTARQGVKL